MANIALTFPDQTYSSENLPSADTLKSDLSVIENGFNAHDSATAAHGATGAVVGTNNSQTLENKTLTRPVLNIGVSGTAILDEDNMASDSATQLATQQSIKAYVDAQLIAAVSAAKEALFPVGSYYFNGAVSTNPATLLGFGTWVAVAGKTLFGLDGTQTEFDTLLETGGAKTKNLAHTHQVTVRGSYRRGDGDAVCAQPETLTSTSGGSTTQSILNPYEVAAIWRRTA